MVAEFLAEREEQTECYLVDTFSPFKTDKLTGVQSVEGKKQIYAESELEVKQRFQKYDNVYVIKVHTVLKFYKESKFNKISFVHVDLNFHEAEIMSLSYLWNRCAEGCIFLLDDYANYGRDL